MSLQKISACLFILGSAIFVFAAFHPFSQRFFPEPDRAKRWEMVSTSLSTWNFIHVFFSVGAIVTALGSILYAIHLKGTVNSSFSLSAAALIVCGSALWVFHCYLRVSAPKDFVEGLQPGWNFVVYTIFMIGALFLYGWLFRESGLPPWSGWTLMIGSGMYFLIFIIFRDLPPFSHYVLGMMMGIVLLVR